MPMPQCPAREAPLTCERQPLGPTCIYCRRHLPEGQLGVQLRAARRIKRALLADADRAAGIDTSKRRPLIDSLPALQAQLAVRHDLPMRVVADMLDEVVPMLELLARVREIVDAGKGGSAMAFLNGFADIRDVLYPDTEVARQQDARRRMTADERAAERARAESAEAEAWAGIRTHEDPPEDGARPLILLSYDTAFGAVVNGHCHRCGMTLGTLPGGGRTCVRCDDPVDDEGTDG